MSIFAQAHLGHTPNYTTQTPPPENLKLAVQVECAMDMFLSLREAYPLAKIIMIGHSIGSWISLQVRSDFPAFIAYHIAFIML